ncbi:MAG TPA: MFS transporter, partial [Patescibacteria group bacterium]|nr:MFS transporter [Patescibacteria group bacterium]
MESPLGHRADWRLLLESRGFVFLFIAMFVSLLGTGMNFAGVSWWVFEQTKSPVQVGLLTVLVMMPGLVVPVVGGVLIDRLDRRRLGMVLDMLRGAIVLSTAGLVRAGLARIWHIYAMVYLLGVGFAIYWSTVNALAQEVIPRGQYATANAGVLIAIQGGMMTGGSLVGFVYKSAGLAGILGIDGTTYLVAATCLFLLRRGRVAPQAHRESEPEVEPGGALAPAEEVAALAAREDPLGQSLAEPGLGGRFLRDLREGARFLRGQPRVLALGLTYACMMGGVISSNVLLVTLTQEVLHSDARGFGYMEAGWAFGAVSGGLTAGVFTGWISAPLLLIVALAVLAAGHPLFPYVGSLAVAVALNAVFGMCRAFGGVLAQTGIMLTVPRRLMGRTQSTFSMLATVLQVLMSLTLGYLAEHLSLPLAFFVLGLIYGCAVLA